MLLVSRPDVPSPSKRFSLTFESLLFRRSWKQATLSPALRENDYTPDLRSSSVDELTTGLQRNDQDPRSYRISNSLCIVT